MTDFPFSSKSLSSLFNQCVMTCNGCGQPMRYMGEWPVQYPTVNMDGKFTHGTQQAARWACKTCRTPKEGYEPGLPVMCALIPDPEFIAHCIKDE